MEFSLQLTPDGVYYSSISQQYNGKSYTLYLGMERIDEKNIDKWKEYKYDMYHFSKRDRGLGVMLPLLSENIPPYDDQLAEVTGFSKTEYVQYMQTLQENKMYSPSTCRRLDGISSGVAGFSFTVGDYIVYISPSPIVGRYSFNTRSGSNLTLKEFISQYKNIIMSVRSDINSHEEIINNRGIFRNPIYTLPGDYPNISLLLHRFTSQVGRQYLNKIYLGVSPISNMSSILFTYLKGKEYYTNRDESLSLLEGGKYKSGIPSASGLETQFLIPISSLS